MKRTSSPHVFKSNHLRYYHTQMPDRVYLDWNATTPLRREAREAMAAAWGLCGNPSSVHAEGRQARRLVEEARAMIAGSIGALPRNVIFASGGTEANALALTPGLRRGSGLPAGRLLVSAIEHASVLSAGRVCARLRASGREITGLGNRARFGARGGAVCARGDRHHRRHALRAG